MAVSTPTTAAQAPTLYYQGQQLTFNPAAPPGGVTSQYASIPGTQYQLQYSGAGYALSNPYAGQSSYNVAGAGDVPTFSGAISAFLGNFGASGGALALSDFSTTAPPPPPAAAAPAPPVPTITSAPPPPTVPGTTSNPNPSVATSDGSGTTTTTSPTAPGTTDAANTVTGDPTPTVSDNSTTQFMNSLLGIIAGQQQQNAAQAQSAQVPGSGSVAGGVPVIGSATDGLPSSIPTTTTSSTGPNWLLIVLVLGVIAGLFWWFKMRKKGKPPE